MKTLNAVITEREANLLNILRRIDDDDVYVRVSDMAQAFAKLANKEKKEPNDSNLIVDNGSSDADGDSTSGTSTA